MINRGYFMNKGALWNSIQDGIQNSIEVLADVFSKKSEDQIAVLLKQGIFATISPVGLRVAQMVATVQFDGDSGRRAKQINLHPTPAIAWNRQLCIQTKFPVCCGQSFESSI
jgi:hypothetical protein